MHQINKEEKEAGNDGDGDPGGAVGMVGVDHAVPVGHPDDACGEGGCHQNI